MLNKNKIVSLLKQLKLTTDNSIVNELHAILTQLDAESLDVGSISAESLDIDFTDTLSYITEEDYEIAFGKAYISPLGWQDLVFVSDFIGSSIVEDNYSIFNFAGDGSTQIGSLGISFPSQVSGQLLTVNSGSLSGSSLTNVLTYTDTTALGEGEAFTDQKISVWVDPVSSDISWFTFQNSFDENLASSSWSKRNNAGEQVELKLEDSQEGFRISNDLSDNTASVLRVEDNNGDARLEVKNDGVTLSDLTIDFTDTLSYVTDNNLESPFGFQYIPAFGGFIDIDFSGDFIGSKYQGSDVTITKGLLDGETELVGLGVSVSSSIAGTIYEINSGDYSGSSLSHGGVIIDQTGIGGSLSRNFSLRGNFIDTVSGDKTFMGYALGVGSGTPFYIIAEKTNDAGEVISIQLDESETGFVIANDLSDNTASVLRIEDNNGDAILEFFNDYLVSETIPALDYADDAAAATGGVPVGGIYHNSGTIKIRLT